jgi:hypothetical protein
VTNLYDRTGHCVRHPHVRLRKKKLWGGGWNILIANCPDCCLKEMGRLVELEKQKDKTKANSNGKKEKKEKKIPKSWPVDNFDESVPIFEFDIPLEDHPGNHGEFTSPKSVKSCKSILSKKSGKTSKTAKSSGGAGKSVKTKKSSKSIKSAKSKSNTKELKPTRRPSASAACLAKMPYTDHFGCRGLYSGEVNSFGQPHGKGFLTYDDGGVNEGIWENGVCAEDERDCGRLVAKSVSNKSVSG